MDRRKRIRQRTKRFKAMILNALSRFESIVDEIEFTGFGDNPPCISTDRGGSIYITFEDVDYPLEEVIPYMNDFGELSKQSLMRIAINE